MKIAFFTEGTWSGNVSRDNPNMRTEMAWMCALKAEHWNINQPPDKHYDLGIVITPKNNPRFDINSLKQYCNKIAIMQEGPNWYWQDYPLDRQIWYFNSLIEADFLLCHNKSDQLYYQGLTSKPTYVMPSLMIEDAIGELTGLLKADVEREGVIIGGNMCSWYGGFDSMLIAQDFDCKMYAPSMGRKIEGEDQLDIEYLPYMNWTEWIKTLNNFKYGVHLMRTHAAGTVALNCACLGIPCIGYNGLDTQMLCHPECTVEIGDLVGAKQIAEKLRNNEKFYLYCSNIAKEKYKEHFSETVYKDKLNNILKKI